MEIAQVCSLQVFSKLPMVFDVAFQTDFINLALVILGERWQRTPVSYIWFEVLILNRTVRSFLPPDSACYKVSSRLPGKGWSVMYVGGAASDRMGEGSCPSSKFSIKVQNCGDSWPHWSLSHPSLLCQNRSTFHPNPKRSLLRDLSRYQCSKHCGIYCQSSPVSSTLERFS